MTNEETPFRLRPRRPIRQKRDEIRIWSAAFKRLSHIVRMSSRRMGRAFAGARPARTHSQRCAVRVTYSTNKAPGQWCAHGRYLARESATEGRHGEKTGFGPGDEPIPVATTLENWQSEGDERMFKLIISPEFGERMDLEAHTRSLMVRMEQDLGTTLEWVAVSHHNTQHPHVHVALRGINDRGQALRLERDYIRFVIRHHAEDLCTAQLGYRTQLDAEEAQRREIDQCRYTSLDRLLNRTNKRGESGAENSSYFTININPNDPDLRGFAKAQQHHVSARLLVLQQMALAESAGFGVWHVRRDFEDVLRAMQRATDRQKTLAAHGALLSDERLRLEVTRLSDVKELEGRVLGHGQEDSTGRGYVLIEGTDGKVHFIYQDDSIDAARHRGLMRVNSFVKLRNSSAKARTKLIVEDLGDAEKVLDDKIYMHRRAQRVIKSGAITDEDPGWGGWLGRYNARLRAEVKTIEGVRQRRGPYSPEGHGRK
jgi:type IV secretory pathway VirD2 relaxase